MRPPPEAPPGGRPRIVDLVFGGELPRRRHRAAVTVAAVLGLYAGVLALLGRFGARVGRSSAEPAARVHDAFALERAVDVTPPPAPPPPAPARPETPPVAAAPPRTARAPARGRAAPPAARPGPAAPAQAGRLAAVSQDPADFTGSAFIVGAGSSYAGGATTSGGTARTPPVGSVAPSGRGDGSAPSTPSRARPVALDETAWSCPWPVEADAREVDEETVIIRATVGADGRAESVDVIADPGFGFGRAARACALGTRFGPAHDHWGNAVRALSPPIHVHFFR